MQNPTLYTRAVGVSLTTRANSLSDAEWQSPRHFSPFTGGHCRLSRALSGHNIIENPRKREKRIVRLLFCEWIKLDCATAMDDAWKYGHSLAVHCDRGILIQKEKSFFPVTGNPTVSSTSKLGCKAFWRYLNIILGNDIFKKGDFLISHCVLEYCQRVGINKIKTCCWSTQ